MRIINNSDVREFPDESGDILVLRSKPFRSHYVTAGEMEEELAAKKMKRFGIDMLELQEKAKAEQEGKNKKKPEDFPETLKFRFDALCVAIKRKDPDAESGYRTIDKAEELADMYERMYPEDRAWIDGCTKEIWEANKPADAEKN
jgi:hypothetical protein